MQTLKHTWLNLQRKKLLISIQTLLLCIFFSVTLLLLTALNSFNQELTQLKEELGSQVSISQQDQTDGATVISKLRELETLPYVSSMTYEGSGSVNLLLTSKQEADEVLAEMTGLVMGMEDHYYETDLIEGSNQLKPQECLITKEYSEHAGVNIGDKVAMTNDSSQKNKKEVQLTVVGVVDGPAALSDVDDYYGFTYLYVSLDTLEWLNQEIHFLPYWQALYYLKDSTKVKAFNKEVETIQLGDDVLVESNSTQLEFMGEHLVSSKKQVQQLLIASLCLGLAGIYGFSLISRRRERTIDRMFLLMGMKKRQMAASYFMEIVIQVFISLTIALTINYYLAGDLTQWMLDYALRLAQTSIYFEYEYLTFLTSIPILTPITEIETIASIHMNWGLPIAAVLLILMASKYIGLWRNDLTDSLLEGEWLV